MIQYKEERSASNFDDKNDSLLSFRLELSVASLAQAYVSKLFEQMLNSILVNCDKKVPVIYVLW